MTDEQVTAELKACFEDYDYHLKHMLAKAARIKELAPVYWTVKGYTVYPRLEKLRPSVFGEVVETRFIKG